MKQYALRDFCRACFDECPFGGPRDVISARVSLFWTLSLIFMRECHFFGHSALFLYASVTFLDTHSILYRQIIREKLMQILTLTSTFFTYFCTFFPGFIQPYLVFSLSNNFWHHNRQIMLI